MMKKLILLAGVAALGACADSATNDAATNEMLMENAAVEVEGPGAAGTYAVFGADGEAYGTAVHNADGTYTSTDAEGNAEPGGTWANVDGKLCIDETEAEGEEDTGTTCWTPGDTDAEGRTIWTSDAEEPQVAHVAFTPA